MPKLQRKNKSKFDEMRADTTKRIIDACIELFSEYGYYATTIQMVADRAGVVPSGIYHYYSGKEDLFEAVAEALSRDLLDWVIDNTRHVEPTPESLDECFSSYVRSVDDNMTTLRLLLRLLIQKDSTPNQYVDKLMSIIRFMKLKLSEYTDSEKILHELETIMEDFFGAITLYVIGSNKEIFERQTNDLKARFVALPSIAEEEEKAKLNSEEA